LTLRNPLTSPFSPDCSPQPLAKNTFLQNIKKRRHADTKSAQKYKSRRDLHPGGFYMGDVLLMQIHRKQLL
jgi:hypothetical protein